MWKLLLLLAVGCAALFSFLNTKRASKKVQLNSFRYNWSDPTQADCEEVFQAEPDGPDYVKLSVKSFDAEGNTYVHTGRVRREEFMAGLQSLSQKQGLDKWNGFAKNNPSDKHNVFRLEANYSDGRNIAARGSNSVPDGYGPAVKEIKAYFKANCR